MTNTPAAQADSTAQADVSHTQGAADGPRLPSRRVSAGLAGVMLAVGIALGAAIGPAPEASFAGSSLQALLPALAARAGESTATTAVKPPPTTPQPTPSPARAGAESKRAKLSGASASGATSSGTSPTTTTTTTPASKKTTSPQAALPAISHVWLIVLPGQSLSEALAQPTRDPYLDSQLIPKGTMLSSYSSLAGSELANEVGPLAGQGSASLTSIVPPSCATGATAQQCNPSAAAGQTAGDDFLEQIVQPIIASADYRSHGLIVITFDAGSTIQGSITSGSTPASPSITTTLAGQPPTGVLLLSPFVRAGVRSSAQLNPSSPQKSLEGLFK